ncbi:hypothetical protein BH10BAC4_BH10BAC4_10790 [soil metagenome]
MKLKSNYGFVLASAIVSALLTQMVSCKKSDPAPSTQEVVKEKLLANNWKVQSVTVDDVDRTSMYQGMTIQFAASTYTTTNGAAIWPATGAWSFTSGNATKLKRDDGIEVKIDVMDTTLKLSLNWPTTTLGSGRFESIKGQNVFNFIK